MSKKHGQNLVSFNRTMVDGAYRYVAIGPMEIFVQSSDGSTLKKISVDEDCSVTIEDIPREALGD